MSNDAPRLVLAHDVSSRSLSISLYRAAIETCEGAAEKAAPDLPAASTVFAMLDVMFDEEQRGTLSDALQTALMLAYNKRRVG